MSAKTRICLIFFVWSLFASLFLIPKDASALSCGTISTPGVYTLDQDLNAPGTCFIINADNVVLDGLNMYTARYSTGPNTGYAVQVVGVTGVTIRNMNMIQVNSSVLDSPAIYATGMDGSTIQDSTITINGGGNGISLLGSSTNAISNNAITTPSKGITLGSSSNSNTITNNIITTYYQGIDIFSSKSNTISSNTITTSGLNGYAIISWTYSNSSTITNNIITTNGPLSPGIIQWGAITNTISDNTITTSGSGSTGIYSYTSSANTISNNIITTSNTSAEGIFMWGSCNSNILSGNTITTSGNSSNGIHLYAASNSNTISNNTLKTSGSSGTGIYLRYFSDLNMISNNTIKTSNTSAYGIHINSSNTNTFSGNTVTTAGSDGYGIFLWSSSSNNITGGSITSKISYDYYLRDATTANNFMNTNFTAERNIFFYDAVSWFNYDNETNDNIWLNTRVSTQSSILRILENISTANLRWNDSGTVTATYVIKGLIPLRNYDVYNTSLGITTKSYSMTTDAYGDLTPFTIRLNGATRLAVNLSSPTFPIITVQSPLNKSYADSSIWFNVTLSKIGSWVGYSLDGAANISLTNSTGRWWALDASVAEGTHTVKFFANSTSGGMNSTSITFTVDTIPPTIIVQSPANKSYMTSTIWFNVTGSEILNWCGYSLDGAANVSMTNSSGNWNKYVAVPDGNHAVVYSCRDTSGNANKSLPVYFTVDTTPPVVSVTHPPVVKSMSTIVFNVTCFDATSGCNYTKITATPYSCTVNHLAGEKNCSITLTTECETGSYGYSVISEDLVGNVNTYINGQFSVKKGDGCPCMTFDECMSGSCIGYELCAPSTPVNLYIVPANREQINVPLGETEAITLRIENPIGIADTVKFKIEGYPAEIELWAYFDGQKYGSLSEKTVSIGPNSLVFVPLNIYGGKTGVYKLSIGAVSSATQQWAYNQTNIHISFLEKEGVNSESPEINAFAVFAAIIIAAIVLEMRHNKDQI